MIAHIASIRKNVQIARAIGSLTALIWRETSLDVSELLEEFSISVSHSLGSLCYHAFSLCATVYVTSFCAYIFSEARESKLRV